MPVPPPTMRDRRVAESLQPRQPHHGEQRSDVQARRRRIEADVRGDALRREQLRQPLGGVVHHPAPVSSSKSSIVRRFVIVEQSRVTISVDGRSAGARVLKALARHRRRRASTGERRVRVSATSATRSSVTRATCRSPACRRRWPVRIGLHHRRPSQPLGLARGCRARRRAADGEQPDLIVLGGDYVTWGDRQYVGPSAERSAPCRRRTACSASSATTTTTTTCRRRSPHAASRC